MNLNGLVERRLRFEAMEERALLSVQPAGDEFVVNSTTLGDQRGWVESLRAVAANSTGDSVVTWSSDGQDGSEWGVYARRISATNGMPAGPEIPVNQFTAGAQLTSTVAMDADGDFVIAWASAGQDGDGYGIYARRFDASGEPAGDEFRVNESTAGEQVSPSVAINAEGAFVVSWQSKAEGSDAWDIVVRVFDNDGIATSGDIPVNFVTSGDQFNASSVVTLDDQIAITWTGLDASESGVFVRFFNFAGTPLTSEIQVNQLSEGNQGNSTIANVGPGSVVVCWWAQSPVMATNFDLFARVYSTAGVALTNEFPINTSPGVNTAASVAGSGEGVFAVAWARTGVDGAGEGIVTRAFAETGAPLSAEKKVNEFVVGDQTLPSVAFDESDQMLVAWSSQEQDGDGFGVYARRFTVRPATITVEDVVAIHHDAIPLNDFVSHWSLNPTNGKPYLLLAQSNWTDADAGAEALGGYLVAVGDQVENDWVWRSFSGGGITRMLWIGLNDQESEGVFEWTNGEPVVFTDWQPGQPWDNNHLGPEDFVQMGYSTCPTCSKWNDLANTDFWDSRPMQGVIEFDTLQPAFTNVPSEAVLDNNVLQLMVGFDVAEELLDEVASPISPANPANWQLAHNGIDISEKIAQIDWVFNAGTSRYEAVLSFDDPLGDGRYDLTVLDGISDNYGNQLDGDGDGNPGGDFVRTFYIGGAAPVADTGGPYLVTEGESLVLDASATTDIDSLDSIYWTNVSGASLQVANQDGSGLAALVTEVSQPRGMAVDTTHRFAYWTELGERAIRRASLDGPGTDEFVVDVRNGAAGNAFDLAASKMYWSDSDATDVNNGVRSGKIRRANLDGSNPEDIIAADLRHPAGVAVDSVHGKIYWSDLEGHLDGTGAIRRANLNGTGMETFVDGIDEANGIALDLRHGKLYWTESSSGRIQRANLNGSGVEDVLTGLVGVTTIALNLEDETLYWTESGGDVRGASVDGSVQFTVAAGIGEPWGIAVVPALRYEWDIDGDGDYGDAAGINPVLSWQQLTDLGIADEGVYPVRLRVTDELGLTSDAEATLTVHNAAPTNLQLDPLEAYLEGSEITLTGRFDDPGTLDTHIVYIDWGDGEPEVLPLAAGINSIAATHQYRDDNQGAPYAVAVTVVDDDGGVTVAGGNVSVSNADPTIAGLKVEPAAANEGDEATMTGSIEDLGLLDTHNVLVSWGDGSASDAIVDQATRNFAATHRYLDDNPSGTLADVYSISVSVTDDDGGVGNAQTNVTVNNVSPTVAITATPIVVNVGNPFTLEALVHDPGVADSIDLAWVVTHSGATVATGVGDAFTFTPVELGAYVFTLTGTDDDGGIGTAEIILEAGPCLVPGDTDGNCAVDLVDLNNVRNHFGETGLGVVDLSFNTPAPGTLLDKDGVGTGFTHRLPGTGDDLPAIDPNMDLEPGINGRLLLKSTRANANGGINLGQLETPGVLREEIGQDDFNLTAAFLNVQVPNSGDNLTLYAGTAWNNTVRAGFHDSNVFHIAINRNGVDEILYSTPVNAFAPGDDVTLTLSRRDGRWSVSWKNQTNPAANGESPAFELPWLNGETDLYLGVQHASPTTPTQQTATIDSFTLDILRPIPGDTNGDFIVDLSDLNAVRNNFDASYPAPISEASPSMQRRGVQNERALDRNVADAVFGQLAAVYQEWEGSSPVGNRCQTRANLPRFMRP